MTDLLCHSEGQPDRFCLNGDVHIPKDSWLVGNWYSPAAVARMIEDARMEERDECAKICDRYAIALDYRGNEYTRSREAELCAKIIRKRGDK